MNNRVIVKFLQDDLIYGEKLDILLNQACKSVFPLSIVHNEKMIMVHYKITGYRRLSELNDLPALLVLSIIEKIIFAIEDCQQFLLFPEEYVINLNSIYINDRFDNVRITYIPDRRRENIDKKLLSVIRQLKEITNVRERQYLDILAKRYVSEKISFNKFKHYILKLSREINKEEGEQEPFQRELF